MNQETLNTFAETIRATYNQQMEWYPGFKSKHDAGLWQSIELVVQVGQKTDPTFNAELFRQRCLKGLILV